MENRLYIIYFSPAQKYIDSLSEREQTSIATETGFLQLREFDLVSTKQLRGPIRELIVGSHRLTYFQIESNLYFVRGFRKKSQKTPRQEIEYAENIYKIIRRNL